MVGTASNVTLGPGELFIAPLGTTMPTNASTALNVAFVSIGYTDAGSTFTSTLATAGVEVAESIEDIATYATKRTSTVTFEAAETTAINLGLALNQGLLVAPTAISPVAATSEVRMILAWQGDQAQRWLFRKVYQTGSVSIANKKAPDKRMIAIEFTLEVPATGATFTAFPNASGLI